jgi:hypothetical protein
MSTEEPNNVNTSSQTDDKNLFSGDNDKMLANLFKIIRSQNSDKIKEKNNDENILIDDKEEDEEEDEAEEDDEDDEDDEAEDARWEAINKLLDSHLQISKALLHLVKEK